MLLSEWVCMWHGVCCHSTLLPASSPVSLARPWDLKAAAAGQPEKEKEAGTISILTEEKADRSHASSTRHTERSDLRWKSGLRESFPATLPLTHPLSEPWAGVHGQLPCFSHVKKCKPGFS